MKLGRVKLWRARKLISYNGYFKRDQNHAKRRKGLTRKGW